MGKSNEEKAQLFLQFVADNEKELKRNLKKNITYNPDIFDDVFQETILKVYNSIIKNGTEIEDFKQYFYIASKWTYVLRDNNNKKQNKINVRDYFDYEKNDISDEEERDKEDLRIEFEDSLRKIKKLLNDNFNKEDVELFFNYHINKSNGKYSIRELCEGNKLKQAEISIKFKEIRNFLNANKDIIEIKKLCRQ